MIAVEKGVPVADGRRGVAKYPFRAMEVGDSFLAPRDSCEQSLRSLAARYSRRINCKFIVRKMADGSGLRVWRTE